MDILIRNKNTSQAKEPSEKRIVTSTNKFRRNSRGRNYHFATTVVDSENNQWILKVLRGMEYIAVLS